MLREAHKGLEVMGMVAGAVKDERWGDAERGLQELQELNRRTAARGRRQIP